MYNDQINDVAGLDFTVTLRGQNAQALGTVTASRVNDMTANTATVTLRTQTLATEGVAYDVLLALVTDTDGNDGHLAGSRVQVPVADSTPPVFRAQLTSASTANFIISEYPPGGTRTDRLDWQVDGVTVPTQFTGSSFSFPNDPVYGPSFAISAVLGEPRTLTSLADPDGAGPLTALTASDFVHRPVYAATVITDRHGNPLTQLGGMTEAMSVEDKAPPVFTARTMSTTTIDVTFSELIHNSGQAAYQNVDHWTVDGTKPGAVSATDRTLTGATTPAGELVRTVYTLTVDTPFGEDATPTVSYVRPASNYLADALTAGTGDVATNNPVAEASVVATDGIIGLSGAAFSAYEELRVTFDDDLLASSVPSTITITPAIGGTTAHAARIDPADAMTIIVDLADRADVRRYSVVLPATIANVNGGLFAGSTESVRPPVDIVRRDGTGEASQIILHFGGNNVPDMRSLDDMETMSPLEGWGTLRVTPVRAGLPGGVALGEAFDARVTTYVGTPDGSTITLHVDRSHSALATPPSYAVEIPTSLKRFFSVGDASLDDNDPLVTIPFTFTTDEQPVFTARIVSPTQVELTFTEAVVSGRRGVSRREQSCRRHERVCAVCGHGQALDR